MEKTLKELADHVGGHVVGNEALKITDVMTIDEAAEGHITFLSNPKYHKKLANTKASAVIVSSEAECPGKDLLVTNNPYLAMAKIAGLFMDEEPLVPEGIHPDARVSPSARLGEGVRIGPRVFIGDNTEIANRVTLHAGVYVGWDCSIGEDSEIYSNASVYPRSKIGNRCIIHCGTVIGCDGFGYAPDGKEYYKIPQRGGVIIHDDVELGANTVVNRGALGNTVIGRGTKIDSLVMIGHNVQIGENTLVVAQAGISGTTKVGNHVTIAGQVGIVGHIEIGDNAAVGAQAGVTRNIPAGQTVFGSPAADIETARRASMIFYKLPEMRKTIRKLEKRVKELEETAGTCNDKQKNSA